MLTIRTRSVVATDGTVTVPVGAGDAGVEVDVIIAPVGIHKPAVNINQEEWIAIVKKTAGSIDDSTFVRPEQLPLESAPNLD